MTRCLAALIVACVVTVATANPAEAGHKIRVRIAAPAAYYVSPPVVYQPAYVVPAPYVVYQPVYAAPTFIGPVYRAPYYYAPRRVEVRHPVWPRGELKIKYKRRWYGYKVEYDYDD